MFEELFKFISEELSKNEFLAGGAILGSLGMVVAYLRSLPSLMGRWLKRMMVTEIDVPDRSDSFDWIKEWLAHNDYSKNAKRITIESKNGSSKITPAPGIHYVWWRKRLLIIRRLRNEGTGDNAHRAFRETWSLTMLARRKYVEEFIEECKEVYDSGKKDYIRVKEGDCGYWDSFIKRRKRPFDSVVMNSETKDLIISDLNKFIDDKEWYNEMNIPWRRGYLLYGPPGNGKSSLVSAVASKLDYPIHVINLKQVSEHDLNSLMSTLDENVILLLEDIDCAFEDRESRSAISFSSLLNTIDGVCASEGRIVFMTTNHIGRLDPALIRPGRIDLRVPMNNASEEQINLMLRRFYDDCDDYDDYNDIVRTIRYSDISMAKLQGFLLKNRESLQSAVLNLKDLKDA